MKLPIYRYFKIPKLNLKNKSSMKSIKERFRTLIENKPMLKVSNMHIAMKIISIISIVVIIIMAAASGIINYFTYNKMHDLNKQSMQLVSSEIYENFNNLIKIQTDEIERISLDNDVVKVINDRNSTTRLDFQNNPMFSLDKDTVNKKFMSSMNDEKVVEHIFITDKSGLIIMDSNSDFLNYDFSQFEFKAKAFKDGSAMSAIYLSSVSSKPIVTFVQAVKDSNGNYIGLVGKSLFIDYFSNRFDNFKFLNDGYIFIVDGLGNITYHPNKYYIGKKIDIDEVKNIIKNNDVFQSISTNYFEDKQGGNIYESYYTSVPRLKSLIILTVDQKRIKESSNQIAVIVYISTLLMTIIIILISNITIKRILKPMSKLIKNTEEISKGNLSIKNDIINNDEIGYLTGSFNRMTKSVKSLITEIKDVVEELLAVNNVIKSSQNLMVCSMETITSNSLDISNDTEEVNKTLESCFNSFKNITERADGIKHQSQDMLKKAEIIMEINKTGIAAVSNLKEVNEEANLTLKSVNNSFENLGDNLDEIKNIVLAVTNISKQTHILSLNASIEAARAGEYGAGFKVVAQEIKKLSMSIVDQMDRITSIVLKINSNTSVTRDNIVSINKVSHHQNEVVLSTVQNFKEILKSTEDIVSFITSIDSNIYDLNNETDYVSESLNDVRRLTTDLGDSIAEVGKVVDNQYSETKNMDKLIGNLEHTSNELNASMGKFIM
jgi:methyl-accepting chemotaxis protein